MREILSQINKKAVNGYLAAHGFFHRKYTKNRKLRF